MSQMILDTSAGTYGTQYEVPRASSFDTSGPSTRVLETQTPAKQDTSALAVKSDQETHTTRLSLGKYFVGVDIYILF
jgi:hypothetical protein